MFRGFLRQNRLKPRHKNKSHQRRCAAANRPPRTGLHFDDHRADSIPLNPFPNGTPYLHNNLEQRWLTPRVQAMQIDEKGMGFHAFRRFRKTWLRGERCQEDINNFWMGHQPETMSELNSRMEFELDRRLEEAEKIGVGFTVPSVEIASIAPSAPRNGQELELELVW
ncbi:MAG TPA: hypothetical protein VE822_12645 [Candidatus Elarobacter sp.]|nr:hypothetical protein [Candidatus Elarobacter sp.]